MLYFKALTQGLSELPEGDAEVRAEIDARASRVGWPALHRQLAEIDPATAARLDPADRQRIQRALEIVALTGQPMSALLDTRRGNSAATRQTEFLRIALMPSDRSVLHRRIADRFEHMLDAGLVEEVRALRERFALTPDLPSMRAVGYRQAWQHLDGEYDRATLHDRGIFATRQLAKRQLSWLRAMEATHVLDCLAPDLEQQAEELIARRGA